MERAIEEELAKTQATEKLPHDAEDFGSPQQPSARKDARPAAAGDTETEDEKDTRIKALEDELFNLKVDKAAKDQFVTLLKDQLTADRTQFKEFVAQIAESAHKIGELETKLLLQLEGPQQGRADAGAASSRVTYDMHPTEADAAPEDAAHEPVTVHVVAPDAPDQTSSSLP